MEFTYISLPGGPDAYAYRKELGKWLVRLYCRRTGDYGQYHVNAACARTAAKKARELWDYHLELVEGE